MNKDGLNALNKIIKIKNKMKQNTIMPNSKDKKY